MGSQVDGGVCVTVARFAVHRVHDCSDVIDALFQHVYGGWTVRESRAALVEADQTTEGTKPFYKPRIGRPFPHEVEVGGSRLEPSPVRFAPDTALCGRADAEAQQELAQLIAVTQDIDRGVSPRAAEIPQCFVRCVGDPRLASNLRCA